MNQLEMTEYLSEQIPFLEERDGHEWKEAERLRKEFTVNYSIEKIAALSLDEYVIGKGSSNRSFCYQLERTLDSLGRILGARADKFGVYYGRTKSDATKKYRFARHWGEEKNEAFEAVKQSIVNLLKSSEDDNIVMIRNNKLSPMLKGKLLFIYHPNKFAPIYSKAHLEHFLAHLNINGTFESETDMQRALMDYRAKWPELEKRHPCLYMRLLYDLFHYPKYDVSSSGKKPNTKLPLLSAAIEGAIFIKDMPAVSDTITHKSITETTNYLERQKRLKHIGDRGESVVLEIERQRLINAKRNDLANKVTNIEDDKTGYDILSFDEDGTERQIEVKATSNKALDRGFYITANELDQASKLTNYYIYIVFSAMSIQPRILPLKNPDLNGKDFDTKAIAFHVSLKKDSHT